MPYRILWDDEEEDSRRPSITADEVIVADDRPRFIGLVDSEGQPIYRVPDRVPIGFAGRPRIRVAARCRRLAR